MQTFNSIHANEILKPCGIDGLITIDEYGVWPKVEYDATQQGEPELFRWRPARVFQGEPDAPEVAGTPMLPFPFNSRHLAAFMLEGVGALVSGFYGDWEDGPNLASLNAIDPDSNARTAIVQAYAARRESKRVVGAYPLALDVEAERARKAYNEARREANAREGVSGAKPGTEESKLRLERAKASIAELDLEMDATANAARAAQQAWLNAMVRELLQPAPAQSLTSPAPVVTDKPAPVNEKPWLVIDPKDPIAEQPWYTPARYFARQLVLKDSTLLTKRQVLADKVSLSLCGVGIYKRGGKKRHAADTVLKAFSNVALG